MTNLQSMIICAGRCIAAVDSGNEPEFHRLMEHGAEIFRRLTPTEVTMFRMWSDDAIPEAGVDALLASEETS